MDTKNPLDRMKTTLTYILNNFGMCASCAIFQFL